MGTVHWYLAGSFKDPAYELNSKHLLFGDNAKFVGDTGEGKKDVAETCVVGHKDIRPSRLKSLQAFDLDSQPSQCQVNPGPVGEAAVCPVAARVQQATRERAALAQASS